MYLVLMLILGACSARPAGVPVAGDDTGPPPDSGDAGGADAGDAGSDADAGPPDLVAMCGAAPQTLEDWESCYRKRYCELTLNCGSMNLFRDVQECITLGNAASGGQLDFEARERSRAIAAERASRDDHAFTQCLADMNPTLCLNPDFSFSCATRFTGTILDGQSCYTDIECQSPGAICSSESCGAACCLGVCKPRRELNARCSTSDRCLPGLKCSLDGYCVSGDVDSVCADSGDCDPNNWCNRLTGRCEADAPEGAPCTLLTQCGGETSCVGLRRRVEPARCRPVNVEYAECDYVCMGNLYCDLSNPVGFGVCRSLPKHDEACGLFLPCIGKDQVCESGTCVTRPGKDQPCIEGVCLPGLFCTDQLDPANPTCQPLLIDGGGSCKQPDQCQSHICSATGQCQQWVDPCP
jgi:hypothetical protein